MKKIHSFYICLLAFSCGIVFSSFVRNSTSEKFTLPYKKAGLTEQQAAAHLLSRFTYGAKAGDVDAVVKEGLEKWLVQQLDGKQEDASLNQMLSKLEDINLTNTEVENIYPRNAQIVRYAVKDGVIHKDSVNKANGKEYRAQILAYMKTKGYKPQQELYRQFINQKILRATYTNNQLQELMTDFWFNHFNVSLNKNQCASYVPAYERDVIRPNVIGKFENLVLSTAKSPAMLMYLDNFSSAGTNVPMENAGNDMQMAGNAQQQQRRKKFQQVVQKNKLKQGKGKTGLNENYAREVMELHTLGVDGGYTQSDVTQAARVLTGWTIAPMGDNGYGAPMKKLMETVGQENLLKRGFVLDGDFIFAINRHDNGEKTVLGKKFPAGGGYEEGVELLKMLAHHNSTAKFISRKLATRFVNDNPPQSLIDKMAKTFLSTEGDIKSVLITMASSPEFWSKEALREKTKSPFELAISAVRSLDAKVNQPYQLYTWISKMGQQMYYYQAPTGFPDKGQYWINTGSLLNRMNFGLALASQRIPGITFSLAKMNNNHEPESAEAALVIYSKLFMPERKLDETIARLKPMLNDPNLETNVANAAQKSTPPQQMNTMANEDANIMDDGGAPKGKGKKAFANATPQQKAGTNTMLSQVVGVIIGSPEFQRK
ncbi:DUF1800 domain-containing protein [Pedobacter frigiditerrae]|uniref:DUF1800 domain-containing protein n=1 Tax=Pedobacter frigiditerrae TaxID=2530452 RepID=A0A4R0N3G7_9SPHI|nr:DUF1800 domain-containing protein [Pedobacter frigiditerrae]TCC94340.1 DUF1800 domain-containing protein [Pedobacter frigiditerrae]